MKFSKLEAARPGDSFMFKCANYWGRGKSPESAYKQAREAGAPAEPKQWIVYSVHPKAYCEECYGDTVSPKGHAPVKLASYGI